MTTPEKFNADLHTPDTLSEAIARLPADFVLVGSIGRCVLMERLKPLERRNGSATDIDVIDQSGQRVSGAMQSGPYRVDSLLTRSFRPFDEASWGLFLPGQSSPIQTIEKEFCTPVVTEIPWGQGETAKVLPALVQNELVNMFGGYRKNREHMAQFRAFVESQPKQLPPAVRDRFQEYRRVRQRVELHGTPEHPVTLTERTYRRLRRTYYNFSPRPIQRAVEQCVGPTVRKLRGTNISAL